MPAMIDAALSAPDYRGIYAEPSFSGVQSFYRRRYSKDLAGVDLAVAGIPMDSFVTNRPGARFGPEAIRRASSLMSWDAPWPWKRNPFAELAIADYGDCYLDPGRPDSLHGSIRDFAREILKSSALMALGGDHYISYPLLEAHAEKHGPLALIHFDAHSDTWKDEPKRLDHGTMFYHAAREGIVDAARSAQLGIRSNNADDYGFTLLDAAEIHAIGARAVCEKVRAIVGSKPAYLSFDIDCLDPAYAPGTGTPVCGGLSTWQAREILLGLAGLNIVGMDLVEVSPSYDHAQITALAGATLASDLLCLYLHGRRP
ncbi:MAG TPA: agmatinase [Spirochaetaceae bacterium]|nr:agmatinase [Spirochaetaceae bacterium]